MKSIKISLVVALLASTLAAAEASKETKAFEVSGDMTLTSNSIWRGASGTNNSATVQGTLGVEHESGAYAGIWATGMSNGTEIDLYFGYATEIAGISLDLGFIDYVTTGADATAAGDYEYTTDGSGEIYLGVGYTIADALDLGLTVYQEVLADDFDSTIVELSVDYDFDLAYAGVAYGTQLEDGGDDYYSLTVGMPFESVKGDLSFTYANTTATGADAVYALSYTTSF